MMAYLSYPGDETGYDFAMSHPAIHAWLLLSITGVGGALFFLHRIKTHNHKPLLEEIETLPVEMP